MSDTVMWRTLNMPNNRSSRVKCAPRLLFMSPSGRNGWNPLCSWVLLVSSDMLNFERSYSSFPIVSAAILSLQNASDCVFLFPFLYFMLNLNSARRNLQQISQHDGSVMVINHPSAS